MILHVLLLIIVLSFCLFLSLSHNGRICATLDIRYARPARSAILTMRSQGDPLQLVGFFSVLGESYRCHRGGVTTIMRHDPYFQGV